MRPSFAIACTLLLTAGALAGCTTKSSPPEPLQEAKVPVERPPEPVAIPPPPPRVVPPLPPPPPPVPHLRFGSSLVNGTTPLMWPGHELWSQDDGACVTCKVQPPPATCGPNACESWSFALDVPEGWWANHTGGLQVSIRWWSEDVWFRLTLEDAAGKQLGVGDAGYYAQTIVVPNATSGNYTAHVQAWGAGNYDGDFQVNSAPREQGPARDLLPDLMTMPMRDLKVVWDETTLFWPDPDPTCLTCPAYYSGHGGSTKVPADAQLALAAAGIKGCGYDEAINGARRCLRFSNYIGNAGEGLMYIHSPRDLPYVPPPGDIQFFQTITRTDGSTHDVKAGTGAYHVSHGHMHYNGIAKYELFHYDLAHHARGAPAGNGSKNGWCFGNEGLIALGLPHTWEPRDGDCDVFGDNTDLFQTLMPGWFDGYETYRPEQYVEITGLPDGVYELVSTANPDHTITESDYTDNTASVVFELKGDDVRVVA